MITMYVLSIICIKHYMYYYVDYVDCQHLNTPKYKIRSKIFMEELRVGKSVRIYGVIYKDIMRTKKLSSTSKLIYCYLLSFSGGTEKVFPGLKLMAEELGLSVKTIIKHRKALEDIGLLTVESETTKNGIKNVYYIQDIDFRESNNNIKSNAIDYEQKKKDKIPYKEIIEYLNEKAGKNFNHNAKGNKKFISARYNEGNSLEDFKRVIDVKVADWLNDKRMRTYLKPETLFNSTNFEKYKNETIEEINERNQYWQDKANKNNNGNIYNKSNSWINDELEKLKGEK